MNLEKKRLEFTLQKMVWQGIISGLSGVFGRKACFWLPFVGNVF